jgi:hypothetical protein
MKGILIVENYSVKGISLLSPSKNPDRPSDNQGLSTSRIIR